MRPLVSPFMARRWVSSTLLCLLFVQAGCVQITPTPEPAVVRFAYPEGQEGHYQPLVEAFQDKHRHITLELVRSQPYRLPEADVLDVSPFIRRFLMEEDFRTVDLLPYVEQGEFERQDLYPGLLDMFDDEGELWAMPYVVGVGAMYYNRDLFDRYGVAYPTVDWTWDDFLLAAQKMYDPDRGIYGYIPDEQFNDVLAMVYQNGGRIFDDLSNPTRTTFNDPLTVEAVDWYAKLMFEHNAIPTPFQARQAFGLTGYTQTGIREGREGMWSGTLPGGAAEIEEEEWDFGWGVAPLPRGKESATFAFVNGLAISPEAESPDACWLWIDFLTRQAPPYGVPVRKSLAESKEYEDQVGSEIAAVARVSIEHALFFSPSGWDIYGTFQIFGEALHMVVGETATAQEAMEWAQERSQYK